MGSCTTGQSNREIVASLALTFRGSVIFAINLVLTLMIATAPPGLQNITAQYVAACVLRELLADS